MTLIRQVGALLLLAGCYGAGTLEISTGALPGEDGVPLPPQGSPPPAGDERLLGAGGRELTAFWEPLEVPLSANVKMLAFDMMKSEVERATASSWVIDQVDQWERNRAALGGPDFDTRFAVDITPSPQKILLWRQMAWQVCRDAVLRDVGAASRTLFTEVDPGEPISTSNAAVNAQLRALYERFFLEPPPPQELARASDLLAAAFVDGNDPREAWRALCVGYLASMKFLTY